MMIRTLTLACATVAFASAAFADGVSNAAVIDCREDANKDDPACVVLPPNSLGSLPPVAAGSLGPGVGLGIVGASVVLFSVLGDNNENTPQTDSE